jgi:hypothetical protein
MSLGSDAFVVKGPEAERYEGASDRLTPDAAAQPGRCRRMTSDSPNRTYEPLRRIPNLASVLDLDLSRCLNQ